MAIKGDAGLWIAHQPEAIRKRLAAPIGNSYLADAVLGAIDGCVTTLAIVAGTAGANLSAGVAIILGLANLLADGISMAISNYQGARTREQVVERTRRAEEEHIRQVPRGEREEIRQIFSKKGFSGNTLNDIVSTITSNRELWVNTMLVEEHGLALNGPKPMIAGAVTFGAFVGIGAIPLLPYLVRALRPEDIFPASALMTILALFGVGLLKGQLLEGLRLKTGIETVFAGSLAAFLAYSVGYILRDMAALS